LRVRGNSVEVSVLEMFHSANISCLVLSKHSTEAMAIQAASLQFNMCTRLGLRAEWNTGQKYWLKYGET